MSDVIDLVSIRNAISALERGGGKQWTHWSEWDKYTLSQVTLGLLLYPSLQMTSRGEGFGGLFGEVLKTLSEKGQVGISSVSEPKQQAAFVATRQWVSKDKRAVRDALQKVVTDKHFASWIDWCIRLNWMETVRRDGSIIDDRFESEIKVILDWSPKEAQSLLKACRNGYVVQAWADRPLSPPPKEAVDGFVLSALLRGRLIEIQTQDSNGHYAFHPLREPVLAPIADPQLEGDRVPPSARRLAAIIVSSALTNTAPAMGVISWAHNLSVCRKAVHYEKSVRFSESSIAGAAVDEAVRITQDLQLQIDWPLVKPIHDEIETQSGFRTLIGIVVAPFHPSPVVSIPVKWAIIRKLGPGIKGLLEAVAAALEKNSFRLRGLSDLSEKAPGKIFMGSSDEN